MATVKHKWRWLTPPSLTSTQQLKYLLRAYPIFTKSTQKVRVQYEELAEVSSLLGQLLKEPSHVAKRHALNWQLNKEEFEYFWSEHNNNYLESDKLSEDECYRVEMDRLKHFARARQKSPLFLTLHYGDYLSSIQQIVRQMEIRNAVIFHQSQGIEQLANFAARLASTCKIELIKVDGPQRLTNIVSRLRKTDAVFAFFDEPATRFDGHQNDFFDKRVLWTRAHFAVANALESLVVPYVSLFEHGRTVPAFYEVLSFPETSGSKEIKEAAQDLANLAEYHIRQFPEYWHYWTRLPEMLVDVDRS